MGLAPLLELLTDKRWGVISVVGGGGKSTFILKATNYFKAHDIKTIVTTTTKMWLWQVSAIAKIYEMKGLWNLEQGADSVLENQFCVIDSLEGEKVKGITEREIRKLRQSFPEHKILVEADGSKGMPLKAHGQNEPVIPPVTDLLVGIIGLDCLYKKIDDVVFRVEEFVGLHKITRKDIVDLQLIKSHINHPNGLFKGAPSDVFKMVVFNKFDIFHPEDRVALTRKLLGLKLKVNYVVITSMEKEEGLVKENENTP